MKIAVLAYVPPPGRPKLYPDSFLANVRKFKSRYPLILYSDHQWGPDFIRIGNPETAVRRDPRLPNGQKNDFAINNLIFFTGLRIALAQDVTHVLYLEADCRVGCDYWDEAIVEEFFSSPRHNICGGSLVCYNPTNAGPEAHKRWAEFISEHNTKKNYPIPTYGWMGAARKESSSVFPNGALGIYSMQWLQKFFDLNQTIALAESSFAWDFAIGFAIWERFGAASYDVVQHLSCIYSSYGDVLTSPEERAEMLRSGKVKAAHQFKGPIEI